MFVDFVNGNQGEVIESEDPDLFQYLFIRHTNNVQGQTMDLDLKVERLEQQLADTRANMEKAASIGKSLLEANQELEQRNDELIASHTKEMEELTQDKYSLERHLANRENQTAHQAAEIESLQAGLKDEVSKVRSHLELEHSHKTNKLKATCSSLQADLELARSQGEQLREQLKKFERELDEARKANTNVLDVTCDEERLSALQEENLDLASEKAQLTNRVAELGRELEQSRLSAHQLETRSKELEERADQEHDMYLENYRALQETRNQMKDLQAELDILQQTSTDPNSKGNSLFAEVEDKRHALEKKLIGIQLRYTTAQKQLNHKNQQVHRLKLQMAGLLHVDQGRVDTAHVERLEQLLAQRGTEVQTLSQKLQEARSQACGPPPDHMSGETSTPHQDGLKRFYQSKLDQAKRELEGVERELVTQQTRRMVLEDQLLACQRKLYRVEKDAHQLRSGKTMLALKVDELKAKLCEHGLAPEEEGAKVHLHKEKIPPQGKAGNDKQPESTETPQTGATKEGEKQEPTSSPSAVSTSVSKTELPKPDTGVNMPSRGAEVPPRGEILKEQNTNVSSSEVTHGRSERKAVSISETVMVVDDDGGSSKRSLVTAKGEEDRGEGRKMRKGAGSSSRGRRGRVVGADVHQTAAEAQMDECKTQ